VTDDRQQTDHATDTCVAIGGIACTRATSPSNWRRFYEITGLLNDTTADK